MKPTGGGPAGGWCDGCGRIDICLCNLPADPTLAALAILDAALAQVEADDPTDHKAARRVTMAILHLRGTRQHVLCPCCGWDGLASMPGRNVPDCPSCGSSTILEDELAHPASGGPECSECGEPATTWFREYIGPDQYVRMPGCQDCAKRSEDREPTDDDVYNGLGMEGGVRYDVNRYDGGRR
jgi:NAD-dependent SIR2 family protein deacetylase